MANHPYISYCEKSHTLSSAGGAIVVKLSAWADVQQATEKLAEFHLSMLDNLELSNNV